MKLSRRTAVFRLDQVKLDGVSTAERFAECLHGLKVQWGDRATGRVASHGFSSASGPPSPSSPSSWVSPRWRSPSASIYPSPPGLRFSSAVDHGEAGRKREEANNRRGRGVLLGSGRRRWLRGTQNARARGLWKRVGRRVSSSLSLFYRSDFSFAALARGARYVTHVRHDFHKISTGFVGVFHRKRFRGNVLARREQTASLVDLLCRTATTPSRARSPRATRKRSHRLPLRPRRRRTKRNPFRASSVLKQAKKARGLKQPPDAPRLPLSDASQERTSKDQRASRVHSRKLATQRFRLPLRRAATLGRHFLPANSMRRAAYAGPTRALVPRAGTRSS